MALHSFHAHFRGIAALQENTLSNSKPVALALSGALIGGLALSGSAFAMQSLPQGYLLSAAAHDHAGAAKPTDNTAGTSGATTGKTAEGRCGEGKCGAGMRKADAAKAQPAEANQATQPAEAERAESTRAEEVKQEGAAKAGHAEGKCGEGKCGGGA
jgi:uncharacterized low-complexity protein